jgi:4-amino-4-deoxy-L-arabinose transferase-like glycosyltransferase
VMAVVFTYLLGKRLRSSRVGLIAAMFLVTNYWFVFLSSTYMSHVSGMALLVMAGWLLTETEEHGSRGRPFLWVLVGLTFGMVVLIRPLTGVAVSFSLWLWILVRGRIARQDYVRMTITLALAAAVPLGFFLYYNRVTTGSAFSTGYSLAQGNIGDFGFGVRGTLVHDELGTPRVISKNFTPLTAVLNLLLTLRDASLSFTPAFFFAPLVGLAIFYKVRFSWRSAMVFLFLPLAHFFFWFRDLRYYSELLPFVMLGIALITDDLAQKNKNMARWAITFLIAGSLLFTADAMWAERKWYAELRPYFTSIEDLQRQRGKLLVFVNDKTALSDIPVLFDAGLVRRGRVPTRCDSSPGPRWKQHTIDRKMARPFSHLSGR